MLYERCRPQSWDQFAGNEKTVKLVRRLIDREDYQGGALWIDGASGTGKTTMAWLIGRQFADDFDVLELDGDRCNVDAVRELEKTLPLSSMFGGWKVVIVNEAHAMTGRAVQAWLTLLERLPAKRIVIFTTTQGRKENLFGDFDSPFSSRCLSFTLSSYGLKEAFAARALEIARAEGLDGQPLAKYERLVQDCKNNMRMVLSEIEAGRMLSD